MNVKLIEDWAYSEISHAQLSLDERQGYDCTDHPMPRATTHGAELCEAIDHRKIEVLQELLKFIKNPKSYDGCWDYELCDEAKNRREIRNEEN